MGNAPHRASVVGQMQHTGTSYTSRRMVLEQGHSQHVATGAGGAMQPQPPAQTPLVLGAQHNPHVAVAMGGSGTASGSGSKVAPAAAPIASQGGPQAPQAAVIIGPDGMPLVANVASMTPAQMQQRALDLANRKKWVGVVVVAKLVALLIDWIIVDNNYTTVQYESALLFATGEHDEDAIFGHTYCESGFLVQSYGTSLVNAIIALYMLYFWLMNCNELGYDKHFYRICPLLRDTVAVAAFFAGGWSCFGRLFVTNVFAWIVLDGVFAAVEYYVGFDSSLRAQARRKETAFRARIKQHDEQIRAELRRQHQPQHQTQSQQMPYLQQQQQQQQQQPPPPHQQQQVPHVPSQPQQ